jgi:hypothetical protein
LQLAGSFQAYPGVGVPETFQLSRSATTGTRYNGIFYSPAHCASVPECVLNAQIVPASIGTIGSSTSTLDITLLPSNSVKFLPYWTQLDFNVAKVFTVRKVRYDLRLEAFNMLNQGFELSHSNTRGTSVGGQSSAFENASSVINGRILRVAATMRF